jgi:hypothetical protein
VSTRAIAGGLESWIINWGPNVNATRNDTFDDVLEDESVGGGLNVTFAGPVFSVTPTTGGSSSTTA